MRESSAASIFEPPATTARASDLPWAGTSWITRFFRFVAIRMSATTDRLLGTAFVLAIGLLPAYGQYEAQIGAVRFPVSCRPAAQKTFERGVALLHSFWYDEAEKAFS